MSIKMAIKCAERILQIAHFYELISDLVRWDGDDGPNWSQCW